MPESESIIKPFKQYWKGMNQRIASTNLEDGVFSVALGVSDKEGAAGRIEGKQTFGIFGTRVMQLRQFGQSVLIQTRNTVEFLRITDFFSDPLSEIPAAPALEQGIEPGDYMLTVPALPASADYMLLWESLDGITFNLTDNTHYEGGEILDLEGDDATTYYFRMQAVNELGTVFGYISNILISTDDMGWLDNSPDKPPAITNAMDDEFNAGSLHAKWTLYNDTGADDTVMLAGGCGIVQSNVATGTRRFFGIGQTAPVAPWTVRAKIALDARSNNFVGCGLFLRSAAGLITQFQVYSDTGILRFDKMRLDASFLHVSNVTVAHPSQAIGYFMVENDGTNLNFYWSATGADYGPLLYTETIAAYLGDVAVVGVHVHPFAQVAAQIARASCDWFRRTV